jgi:cysteine-rich repeat protein
MIRNAFLLTALATVLCTVVGACDAPTREHDTEDCQNSVDDDGNGAIDCADSACATQPACTPENCGNNLDDDGDGRFDCADSDCAVLPACGGSNCGNGVIDPGEDCDGSNLGGRTCVTQGFAGGALACSSCRIDMRSCTNIQPENCQNGADDDHDGTKDCEDSDCASAAVCLCGNGIIDGDEFCDGGAVPDEMSCESEGFPGGTLRCRADCQELDTSMCQRPTCGDHTMSADETCDDGNQVAGDGCDASCQIEIAATCAAARTVRPGVQNGDTRTSTTRGFHGSCLDGLANESLYRYTAAQAGTLTLVLTSATDQGLYVRSDCAAETSELVCTNFAPGGASDALTVELAAGASITIFVDSYSFFAGERQEGPFALLVSFQANQ